MTYTMEASASAFDPESELALTQYKRDSEGIPLLTAEQERDLAYRIQAGLEISREMARLPYGGVHNSVKVQLTPDAQAAQDALVTANLRLVVSVASRYLYHGLSFMDLIQEGNIGLIRAARNYDPDKARFTTHAMWLIRQAIGRAVMENGTAIRVPSHAAQAMNKVGRYAMTFVTSLGREATAEEIAEASGLSVAYVRDALHWRATVQTPLSLDEPIGQFDDNPVLLGDAIEDNHVPLEEATANTMTYRAAIKRALEGLPVREQAIIRKRFGLDGERQGTLRSVGNEYGLSRERVRQLEARALRNLAPRLARALHMEEVAV